jgi:PAS domain-containing protein
VKAVPILDENNNIKEFLGFSVDLDYYVKYQEMLNMSLEKTETTLRKLCELNIMATVFTDVSTETIAYANDKFCEVTGYTKEEIAAGLKWQSITPPEYM